MKIKTITNETRNLVNEFLIDNWFSTDMIIRGQVIDCTKLDGLFILEDNKIIGLLTYLISKDECEIISLDSKKEKQGIGSKLLHKVELIAKDKNCKVIKLITTNDNLNALKFYQKRGYHITKIYQNSMEIVRKIKPNVPLIGENGIPLRDEIELEKIII